MRAAKSRASQRGQRVLAPGLSAASSSGGILPLDVRLHHVVISINRCSRTQMAYPKLSKLELQIMETLWNRGACSIREIQEAFPDEEASLHHRANHGLPAPGGKKAGQDRQANQQCQHLRCGDLSRRRADIRLMDDVLGFSAGGPSP